MAEPDQAPAAPAPAPAPQPVKSPFNAFGGFGAVPVMGSTMTFQEIGNSGLRAFAGYVREEFLPQLQGRQGVTVYREMRDNSPIIGGLLYAIKSTMRKPAWRTVAADDTPAAQEMADFADSLRDDMSHTWTDLIVEMSSMLEYGYAPHEIVYKRRTGRKVGADPDRPGKRLPKSNYDDQRIGWRKISLRGQDTTLKWFFDPNGDVEGMTQQPWVGTLVDLPIEKILLFRPLQTKGNPEGLSVLRNAYRSYYMAKRLEEQEAILFERLNGIPVIKVPSSLMDAAAAGDANASAAIALFKKIAVNLRIDEQMGVVLPSDTYPGANGAAGTIPQYSLELVSPGGSGGRTTVSSDPVIQRHQNNMLISVMADFLTLGHSATGTQALSVSKQDLFFQGVEAYLNSSADVFNRHGLPRVWELNGLDPELMPQYQPDLAQRMDLDVLSTFILRLSQSGMALFPNRDLESALLDAAGLPDVEEEGAVDLVEERMPIVGPGAAAASARQMAEAGVGPSANPVDDEPDLSKTPIGKMLLGSLARRMKRMAGPRFGVRTSVPTVGKRR